MDNKMASNHANTSYISPTFFHFNFRPRTTASHASAHFRRPRLGAVPRFRTVAVPIKDYTRTVVGSLAVSGPSYRIPTGRIEQEIAPLVMKAGRELSSRLGYNA